MAIGATAAIAAIGAIGGGGGGDRAGGAVPSSLVGGGANIEGVVLGTGFLCIDGVLVIPPAPLEWP